MLLIKKINASSFQLSETTFMKIETPHENIFCLDQKQFVSVLRTNTNHNKYC